MPASTVRLKTQTMLNMRECAFAHVLSVDQIPVIAISRLNLVVVRYVNAEIAPVDERTKRSASRSVFKFVIEDSMC